MNLDYKIYNAGLYIRLSREDDDSLSESESVKNQKKLLLQYVSENDFNLVDIYIDDGYSGTNYNRPGFKKMINDILLGKINVIITKDMSRLGRDYIETGNLIEKWFPEHGVRYIAITDNIDTKIDSANNDIAPFKAIMNDMYARDISKKIRASLIAKRKQGEYISARPPYGYKLDYNNKKHLVIDEEKALVVKQIYNLAIKGMTVFSIAKKLTNDNIKTPSDYYNFKWCNKKRIKGIWNSKTIKDILSNPVYTGDLVQYRRKKINYKIKKIVKTDPNEYIIVKNTHDAIIDNETFSLVKKLLPKNVGRCEKKYHYLFDGLLYCGDCGHRISISSRRKKDNRCYTCCNYYRTYRKMNLCSGHSNNYDILEQLLIKSIKTECINKLNIEKIKNEIHKNKLYYKKNNITNNINDLKKEINYLKKQIEELYIDKLNKTIDLEMFMKLKNKINNEILNKTNILEKIKETNIINDSNYEINNYIDKFFSFENINRELILCLVNKIDIFENKKINIYYNFIE